MPEPERNVKTVHKGYGKTNAKVQEAQKPRDFITETHHSIQ